MHRRYSYRLKTLKQIHSITAGGLNSHTKTTKLLNFNFEIQIRHSIKTIVIDIGSIFV